MARKASAFAGKSVVAADREPAEETPEAPQEPPGGPAPAPTSAVTQEDAQQPATALEKPSGGKKPSKKKIGFYIRPEEEERAEAARLHTAGYTGHKTVTAFYEAAIASYTRQLEEKYNDSKPFG